MPGLDVCDLQLDEADLGVDTGCGVVGMWEQCVNAARGEGEVGWGSKCARHLPDLRAWHLPLARGAWSFLDKWFETSGEGEASAAGVKLRQLG
eukprot:366508-Chlamydomonas_euryale.AAC.6